MLIILGMGHSGTKFASKLFKTRHEGFISNQDDYLNAWKDADFARDYIKDIPQNYRDSNSFLVPFATALKEKFPNETFIQLVRDPRTVVPSVMATNGGDVKHVATEWLTINKLLRGLEMPFLRLEDLKGKPLNRHRGGYPTFNEWSKEDQDALLEICKDEMKYYGY